MTDGYGVVLTKHTFQVTAGKKDCTGTGCAGYTRLLPHMQRSAGYLYRVRHTAIAGLAGGSVNFAISGTKVTGMIHKNLRVWHV